MRRVAAIVAATAFVATLVGASTAQASKFIKKGMYDDAQVLYGDPDKVFPILRDMGTQVLRVNLWWGGPNGVASRRPANASSSSDPAYDWSTYDRTVRYSAAFGLKPIFTVLGTPSWANGNRGWNKAPTSGADLKAFVTAAARRYNGSFRLPDGTRGRVASWIAWNEPNNPVFLKPQFVRTSNRWVIQSAKDYARICNAVVAGAKLANPSNKVACGVTSPRGNNQPGTARSSVSPLAFLRAMYLAGARGFDAYAHHPYYGGASETPDTKPPLGKRGQPPTAVTLGNFDELVKELTKSYGKMRIWVTEYGYQTNPPDRIFGVSPAKQALYMRQAWDKVAANPRVDLFIWFLIQDEPRAGSGWQSGVYTSSGKRKPSREIYERLGTSR